MQPYPPIATERLTLRPTQVEDADFICALLNSPGWLTHIGDRGVRTIEDAEQYIRNRMLPQLEQRGYSNNTIVRNADGVRVGVCGVYVREGLDHADIGYALLPEHTQQGYALEASTALMETAKVQYGIKQLDAITTEANTASQNLLRKLGFAFVKFTRLPNDPEELMLFTKILHD